MNSTILSLYYDVVNKQYVKSDTQNIAYGFDTLYYNDNKSIIVQLLTPSSASTNSYPFDIIDPTDSLLMVNIGTIDVTGSIINYTSSLLVPSASVYTGSLNVSGPNLDFALATQTNVTSIWQLKKYTSQSIDTIDNRNITIYKVLDGGTTIVSPGVYMTYASTASYSLTSSYALTSSLPVVNNNPNTFGDANNTITQTVDEFGRVTSWTSQPIGTASYALNALTASYSLITNITSSATTYSGSLTLAGLFLPIYVSGSIRYLPLYS